MALVIDGPKVTSTLLEKQRLCDRYVSGDGVVADMCPVEDEPRFAQEVLVGMQHHNVAVLVKQRQHISAWRPGVRVWDVLRCREDYRKVKERTEAKLQRAYAERDRAEQRRDEMWREDVTPYLDWCLRNRNEGRFAVTVPTCFNVDSAVRTA